MDYAAGPFVFEKYIYPQNAESKFHNQISACGYFQNEINNKIYPESTSDYMNLEYYRGELVDERRLLEATSNFIKGKIDGILYANAYHQIMCEMYAMSQTPMHYEKDKLTLAGLHYEELC